MQLEQPDIRYHSLDGLRAVMMLLGLVLHSIISYGAAPYGESWPFKDRNTTPLFDWLVAYIHWFRMPVFYAMAGFFAAMLYRKRGPMGLARNRLSRILVPFAAAWIVLWPAILLGFAFALRAQATTLAEGWAEVANWAVLGPLMYRDEMAHLWFLWYLLWLYALFLLLVPLVRRLPERFSARFMDGFAMVLGSRLGPVAFAVPTALTLTLMPYGLLATSSSFVLDPVVFLAYLLFFGFGWLLYGKRELLDVFRRSARAHVVAGTLCFVVNMAALGRMVESPAGAGPVALAVGVISGALVIWFLLYGITGLFLRHLDRPVPVVRYVVDASYWLYLIHLPFTIWIPGLLSHVEWPGLVKGIAVLVLCTPVWFASYHWLVRASFIGKVLNGRRYPRRLPVVN